MRSSALQHMVKLLQQMAGQQTNPLLLLLPQDEPVIEQRKYPAMPLTFNDQPLRAYYHCHPAEHRRDDEHGHFHLFVPGRNSSGWSHLAALAMDHDGQPLRWFTVNRWVTDGSWESIGHLLSSIDRLEQDSDMSLVEQWLLCLLQLYRPELETVLTERDHYLESLAPELSLSELLEERTIYLLSANNIVLLEKLQSLLQQPEPAPACG